ncbi:MAG: serine hydrolase domain-containing protein [Saprospiraceae bacterium]
MRTLLPIFSLLFLTLNLNAQDPQLEEQIRATVVSLPEGAEVSIGILDRGTEKTLGYSIHAGALKSEENQDRLFEIGSITKTFTASILMQHIRDGEMHLNDPVQNHLPEHAIRQPEFQGQSIELRHLATHSSGLSTGPGSFFFPFLVNKFVQPSNPYRLIRAKHFLKYLKKFELDYTPGEKWEYSNTGYGLLGYLLEQNNASWEEQVQSGILTPLNMDNTFFKIGKEQKSNLVQGHNEKGKKTGLWEMDFINPAGCMKSCATDMLKYLKAQVEPQPEASLAFIQDTHQDMGVKLPQEDLQMAIAWVQKIADDGSRIYWHNGGTGGYYAFTAFNPATEQGLVILTNYKGTHPGMRTADNKNKIMQLGLDLMERMAAEI